MCFTVIGTHHSLLHAYGQLTNDISICYPATIETTPFPMFVYLYFCLVSPIPKREVFSLVLCLGFMFWLCCHSVFSHRQRCGSACGPLEECFSISHLLLCLTGQSDTDTSDSVISQDSQRSEPLPAEPVAMVTPDLLTAHCGLLTNLLAILPDFTLTAIRHSQLLQALARYEATWHPFHISYKGLLENTLSPTALNIRAMGKTSSELKHRICCP